MCFPKVVSNGKLPDHLVYPVHVHGEMVVVSGRNDIVRPPADFIFAGKEKRVQPIAPLSPPFSRRRNLISIDLAAVDPE